MTFKRKALGAFTRAELLEVGKTLDLEGAEARKRKRGRALRASSHFFVDEAPF
jgi:hypothetical protein